MNTISQIVSVLILWLITGLGFSSVCLAEMKKEKSIFKALRTFEGAFFVFSVITPLFYLIFKL